MAFDGYYFARVCFLLSRHQLKKGSTSPDGTHVLYVVSNFYLVL